MSFRIHSDIGHPPKLQEVFQSICRFCSSELVWKETDLAGVDFDDMAAYHKEEMENLSEIHGNHLLEDFEFKYEPNVEESNLGICPVCGWWLADKTFWVSTKNNIWEIHYGSSGSLINLDLTDIHLPLDIIRQYLAARYESRFSVNPKKFENVVASVFADVGYRSYVTAYSRDGGIDVVLYDNEGHPIGVQVKRYKNTIKVEQIRSFLGALILGKHTKGIFVTTSSYQKGAITAASASQSLLTPIELMDADAFLKLLKVAQLEDYKKKRHYAAETLSLAPKLDLKFAFESAMNSM